LRHRDARIVWFEVPAAGGSMIAGSKGMMVERRRGWIIAKFILHAFNCQSVHRAKGGFTLMGFSGREVEDRHYAQLRASRTLRDANDGPWNLVAEVVDHV
jgi:hypothetical protein